MVVVNQEGGEASQLENEKNKYSNAITGNEGEAQLLGKCVPWWPRR